MNNSNQMSNAVRKIHNLLSSGAVTVTGPTQPRIIKQKIAGGGGGQVTIATSNNAVTNSNSIQQQQVGVNRCYVCDDPIGAGQAQYTMSEMLTAHSSTKFPNKIGQLIGEGFIVIVSVEDVICGRCENLINYLDRLEHDMERVRTNLVGLLHKKYGLDDDSGGGGSDLTPPVKMQKLNSGATVMRLTGSDDTSTTASPIGGGEINRVRKVVHSFSSSAGSNANDSASSIKQTPAVTAVQQIKISTPVTSTTPQQSAGTQTLQRKTTKIYKCLSCDYKTSDMRLFNTHYEMCKQQNFQCKNCKKIFPNFGTMKTHMVREHNTAMDNTCAVCHINFAAESSLRKHMETNHSTNVLVTSTTTLPVGAVVASQDSGTTATLPVLSSPTSASTTLYSCSHCQFKSTDKPVFDEHMRKHMSSNRPKPFKCRLCSMRFETRDAATIHAKQHQPNYFKCGTCQISFSSRDQLVKHFEVHQQSNQNAIQPQQIVVHQTQQQQSSTTPTTTLAKQQHQLQQQTQQQQQQLGVTPQSQNVLTQKRLQESIDEALSETASAASSATDATNANIRFFSCQNCKLTFIQETYYKQHMEQHNRDSVKNSATGTITTASTGAGTQSLVVTNASGGTTNIAGKKNENINSSISGQQSADGHVAETDIESIFEKMHSEKGDSTADSNDGIKTSKATKNASKDSGKNVVITSQDSGSGELTFSISIPQAGQSNGGKSSGSGINNSEATDIKSENARKSPNTVGIDMPILDQPDDSKSAAESAADIKDESKFKTAPVSMPSLDDDNTEKPSQGGEQTHTENDDISIKSERQKSSSEIVKNEITIKEDALEESKGTATSSTLGEDVKIEDDKSHNAENTTAVSSTEADASGNGNGAVTSEQLTTVTTGSGEHHIAMEIDEAMQAQMESGQIKLILSDNGQLLQIDNNHIITDADGNQILMQDPEQLQQLLQSVGVLQAADGIDGEATLQMMTDANGQMVLVQNENNETQLIDASLLNAEGQLVIQPGQDGELGEGAHVIGEDGTRIPVSVSYTADGQPIVQVQQMHHQAVASDGSTATVLEGKEVTTGNEGTVVQAADAAGGGNSETADGASATTNATGGNGTYLALEDLMQQQHAATEVKAAD